MDLESAVATGCPNNIITTLKLILSQPETTHLENIPVVTKLLNSDSNEIVKLTTQAIAESGKHSQNRDKLTNKQLIQLLLVVLQTTKNIPSLTQTCRALGNICYENDNAREIMNDTSSLDSIIPVLETSLLNNDNANTQLTKVICGLLFNYLISNETAQKNALKTNLMSLIEKGIKGKINMFAQHEDVFVQLLRVLSVVSEQIGDEKFTDELLQQLIKILEMSINPEISEYCLELLHTQAENDEVKLTLARSGLCELLFRLVEQHKSLAEDEDSRALMKLACDLIVLTLTGDQSMHLLYANGEGIVYRDMLTWLQSEDIDLVITAVLAIGNFARNDDHCIKMIDDGLSGSLIGILSQHKEAGEDVRLQHALLSALRNLAIPARNKKRLLDEGLLKLILPMLNIEQHPVTFKLLGTLRMLIDGQESAAENVSKSDGVLDRIVALCENADHPGVRAEAPRLLAWLVKNCKSVASRNTVTNYPNAVNCLVQMIPSPHAVMQIEALLALNLLYAAAKESKITEIIAKTFLMADIGKHVAFLLNRYGDKIEKEVVENLLVLLDQVFEEKTIVENLKDGRVPESLHKCLERKDLNYLFDRINSVANRIDSG